MKAPTSIAKFGCALLLAGLAGLPLRAAQFTFDVDVDPAAPGIQTTRAASINDTFTADIYVTVPGDSPGLAGYGFSVRFDNSELNLNGVPATTEINAGGATWSLGGAFTESNDVGGGAGEVSFISATDALPSVNPIAAGTTFRAASINFKVIGVTDDAVADITPYFGVNDGLSDSGKNFIADATFNVGYVVPEPAATGWAFGSLALLAALVARKYGYPR